jgi:hypothetical protein
MTQEPGAQENCDSNAAGDKNVNDVNSDSDKDSKDA